MSDTLDNLRYELYDLKKQKRELEMKIRALENQEVTVGCAKMRTKKIDYQQIYLISFNDRTQRGDKENPGRWVRLYSSRSKQEAINRIPSIVSDLQGLYDKLKEDES